MRYDLLVKEGRDWRIYIEGVDFPTLFNALRTVYAEQVGTPSRFPDLMERAEELQGRIKIRRNDKKEGEMNKTIKEHIEFLQEYYDNASDQSRVQISTALGVWRIAEILEAWFLENSVLTEENNNTTKEVPHGAKSKTNKR